MSRETLVNSLAISGAVALVIGIGMFKIAAGVVALGVLLIVGAVAMAQLEPAKAADGSTKAKK